MLRTEPLHPFPPTLEFTANAPHRIMAKAGLEFSGWIKMILPLLLLIIKVEIVKSGQSEA
jgi:hypothetical protein